MLPSVSAVMIVSGRDEMVSRAKRSFDAQTYEGCIDLVVFRNIGEATIGELRNRANSVATGDIICHWDSDDWSHPNRIAEQVALLQSSGADCVGYREVLFWDTRRVALTSGEAWLYTNGDPRYCVGSSLCYWRSAREKRPFPDKMRGEDTEWLKGVKSRSVSAHMQVPPRMICAIHGGNTAGYDYERVLKASPNWRRALEWDEHCREVMAL